MKVNHMVKNLKSYQSIELLNELEQVYQTAILDTVERELWNHEYEALEFKLFGYNFKSRLAKKTPKKKGYFVTLWEKDINEQNTPLHFDQMSDYLMIYVNDQAQKGIFIFDKEILLNHGILTDNHHQGKMAFRVYPDWETDLNVTALKTQQWQHKYFINLSHSDRENQLSQINTMIHVN